MTIKLSNNIKMVKTQDINYMSLKPSLELIKKDIYDINGYSDEKLCLYDVLYSLSEKVTITINPIPTEAIVKLNMIE